MSSQASSFNFPLHLLSPSELLDKCPILSPTNLIGGCYIPTDGHVEPSSLTSALITGAKRRGVKVLQGVSVIGSTRHPTHRRIVSLQVQYLNEHRQIVQNNIKADVIVNCAGLWARHVGQLLHTSIPTTNVQHQYLVTTPFPTPLPVSLPSFRDPDARLYYKPEQGGLVVGGWEKDTVPASVPLDFGPQLYDANYERFDQHAIQAAARIPALSTTSGNGAVGVRALVNGPIPISPDGEPIMGRCVEHDNVYIAAGFTAGIGAAGGAGRAMSEWIVNGEPELDLWPLDVRRFHSLHSNPTFLHMRGIEAYGHYYSLHYPGKEMHTARNIRKSGVYDILKEKGAVFGTKFGWERPLHFAVSSSSPNTSLPTYTDIPSYHRQNWFPYIAEEHKAAREGCIIVDQSSFGKFEGMYCMCIISSSPSFASAHSLLYMHIYIYIYM